LDSFSAVYLRESYCLPCRWSLNWERSGLCYIVTCALFSFTLWCV